MIPPYDCQKAKLRLSPEVATALASRTLIFFVFVLVYFLVCCRFCLLFLFAFGIRHRDGLPGLCTGPPSARPLVFFLWPAPCAFRRVTTLRLTRLPRHDRGAVPGGNRSAASCLCTVLRRALYHYATRSPSARPLVTHLLTKMDEFQCANQCKTCAACKYSVWIDLANAKRRRKEQKGFFRPFVFLQSRGPRVPKAVPRAPNGPGSEKPAVLFFVAGALCLSAGHHFETYSSTTSRSRPRTRGESIRG